MTTSNNQNQTVLDYLFDAEISPLEQIKEQLADEIEPIKISVILSGLKFKNKVEKTDQGWDLTPITRNRMKKERSPALELVPPRTPVPFKPLSMKNFISAEAKRPDAVQPSGKGYLISGTSEEKLIRGI